MIFIYTTPTCAYCPAVKKYLSSKGVPFEEREAEGEEYKRLYPIYGMTVPLIYNDATDDGMVGLDYAKLKRVAGL